MSQEYFRAVVTAADDDALPLAKAGRWAQAEKRLPRPISRASFERWWRRGCRGQRLETFLVGARRYVRVGELRRFLDAINAADAATVGNAA